MTNLEKYKKAFIDSLSIKNNQLIKNIEYNSIPEWDSIGHMSLMSAVEEAFNISFETDDIIDFSSFEKGKEILNKYNIKL
jgi:acyl carrier protein